jgi:uncharacterized caspase-like protein
MRYGLVLLLSLLLTPVRVHAQGFGKIKKSQTLARLREGVGRVIVASSQVKEQSYESPELGNGFFTYALLRALRGPGSSRPIAEVFSELRDQVAKLSRGRQNPVMSRSDEAANLVLGIEPKAGL